MRACTCLYNFNFFLLFMNIITQLWAFSLFAWRWILQPTGTVTFWIFTWNRDNIRRNKYARMVRLKWNCRRTWHDGEYSPKLKFSFTNFWILLNSQPVNPFVIFMWHCSISMFQKVAVFSLQWISRGHQIRISTFTFYPITSQYSEISSTLLSPPASACDSAVQISLLKDF